MVIKYGGNAMTDPALQADFAEDVVLLEAGGHESRWWCTAAARRLKTP
jgi:acetylglutamate kinase